MEERVIKNALKGGPGKQFSKEETSASENETRYVDRVSHNLLIQELYCQAQVQ